MNLELTKINGTNPYLDYDKLKDTIENKWKATCKEGQVLVLNDFPALISSQVDVDLLIIFHIPDYKGNYYRIIKDSDKFYIRNRILAISIHNEFCNEEISVSNSTILTENALIEFDDEIKDLKWGVHNYLKNRCGLKNSFLNVLPLIWFKGRSSQLVTKNIVAGDELNYNLIEEALYNDLSFAYQAYKDWEKSEHSLEYSIRSILEQASLDSKEGYLTKSKINRIQNKFSEARKKAYNNIGGKLVEVNGTAGTGKTADLLKCMLHKSAEGEKGLLLTYNHLLVNDLSFQINLFNNRQSESENRGSTKCTTIQSFFYNVAKKLGVLIFMSEYRIEQLDKILKARLNIIYKYFKTVGNAEPEISLDKLKMYITKRWGVSVPIKKQALLLISYLKEKEKVTFLPSNNTTKKYFINFREYKLKKLQNIHNTNVFISDYHDVLENIRKALFDLSGFLKEFNVQDKYEKLNLQLGTFQKELLEDDDSGKMNFERLKSRYRRGFNGFRYGRTLYIDEAQDCHDCEKDILIKLFGSENIVLANGGEEQLIRYQNICNWHASLGSRLAYYQYNKKPKSFRMKPAIAKLANHIAEQYKINLNIEPVNTKDHGFIIIDTGEDSGKDTGMIKRLLSKGERQGCTNYESLIMLRPPGDDNIAGNSMESDQNTDNTAVVIDENDIILDKKTSIRKDWDIVQQAQKEIDSANFWNATGNAEKRKMSLPGTLSIRSIYYESCRGLEAWSVMNFGLDDFFQSKWNEKDAERYRLDYMFLSEDERRDMYAATWVLMAITRSIENCYVQLNDINSSLSKCILYFAQNNERYVEGLGE